MVRQTPLGRKGMVLFVLLATLLVAAILTNVISNIIVSHARQAEHQVGRVKAYYAALAAMNMTFENLRTNTWVTGPYSICKNGCSIDDPEIPYRVDIDITDPDGITGLRTITLDVDYTYTPAESAS